MKPPQEFSGHISDFHIEQFVAESGMSLEPRRTECSATLISATEADAERGRDLLKETGIAFPEKAVVIQPGSGGLKKCWFLDNFLALAEELGAVQPSDAASYCGLGGVSDGPVIGTSAGPADLCGQLYRQ
jgi:hypothetical protein